MSSKSKLLLLSLIILLTLSPVQAAPLAAPAPPGWLWGGGPLLTSYEPAGGAAGNQFVRYFDKGVMGADSQNAKAIIAEMVGGYIVGEGGRTVAVGRAQQPVVVGGPSYAAFAPLTSRTARRSGSINEQLTMAGVVQPFSPPVGTTYGAREQYSAAGQHEIASPFLTLPAVGVDWPTFLGLPLADPYWVQIEVAGKPQAILVQLFEQRVLTYNPAAAPGWQVQFANAGRDYYAWRYHNPALREDKPEREYTSYGVRVHLKANYSLDVSEDVSYSNSTAGPLTSILLRVVPRHYKAFTLGSVLVAGTAVQASWRDEINLSVPLPRPLAAGGKVSFSLDFSLRPAQTGVRFGWDQNFDVLTLGDFLPSVLPYENGGWLQYPFNDAGDEGVNAVANYRATYTADGPIVVASTGNPTQVSATEWRYDAPRVRDVAASMSPRFSNPLKDGTYRRTVGGVTLYAFLLPEHRAGGLPGLDASARAFAWYSQTVGAYPYASFIVSEMAGSARCGNYAQEYPMMELMQPDRLSRAVQPFGWDYWEPQHETAHAWFYGIVGNDQSRDPWLDEAMATALNLDYLRRNSSTRDYTAALRAMVVGQRGVPVSSSVFSFPSVGDCVMNASYFYTVYSQGAGFLIEAQKMMGPDSYAAALRAYYRQFALKRATPADFFATMQAGSSVDLRPLFDRYLAIY